MDPARPHHYDVAIIGGGLIGMTLALSLARAGLLVAVIDEAALESTTAPAFDGRVSAIAFASRRLMETIDLWDHVAPDAQPINDILVTDGQVRSGAAPLFLHFDHREIGHEPLGHIVENRHLRIGLLARLSETAALHIFAPATVAALTFEAHAVRFKLSDGRALSARLCVGAEGRRSPSRDQIGIKTFGWSYGQTGIVATVAHEKPHQGFAQEFFLPSGPFAILPMCGNRSSLVWTERSAAAPGFLRLGADDFNAEVSARFGPYLGETRVVGPRWSYPLGLQLAHRYIAPRFALAGDAAHSIHPIAGQGLNLGLRDVAALSEVLVDARRRGEDIGALNVLRSYERWRRFDSVALAASTDLLNRLFSNHWLPLRLARDAGLAATGLAGPARRFFMRYAGGAAGDLPRLLRGEPL